MNRKVLSIVVAIIIASVAGVTGFYTYQVPRHDTKIAIEQVGPTESVNTDAIIGLPRPQFSLADVTGQIRSISEWDGKVVAINFWATWCPPCIKEIPEFIEIQHKYQDQGLQFIGIALQRPEEVTEFMQKYGMNYTVLAGEMEVIKISESYGNDIGALPYTVIIDRDGLIHYVKRGPLAGDVAEAIIAKLL
jgi:peroxiredoxin